MPDRHVSEILTSAFKKLSEQAIKDMYTKDKSSKKAGSSTSNVETAADLLKISNSPRRSPRRPTITPLPPVDRQPPVP